MEEGIYFYRQDQGFYFVLKKLSDDLTLIQNLTRVNNKFLINADYSIIFESIKEINLSDLDMINTYLSKVGDISDLVT